MHDERTDLIFVANRRFDPSRGEEWTRYVAWSGLTQLTELVTLDTMLCPVVPEELTTADWEHNVHEDYRVFWFRSLEYLRARIAGIDGLNLLAVQGNPTAATLHRTPAGFDFAGFDVLDVHGDVSALVNLGGAHDVFAVSELSPLGLLDDLGRAREVRDALRLRHPGESHTECDVWAIWRGRGEGRGARVREESRRAERAEPSLVTCHSDRAWLPRCHSERAELPLSFRASAASRGISVPVPCLGNGRSRG